MTKSLSLTKDREIHIRCQNLIMTAIGQTMILLNLKAINQRKKGRKFQLQMGLKYHLYRNSILIIC